MTDPGRRFALTLVDELARAGLTDACLAPGSRSAPLALALAEHPAVRVHVHVDERSAAFFALGAAKRAGRPAAVLCTSGTAAANLHPAVLEADHARAPLLLLTADRPPELRGTGANQATDQLKLYGTAVRWFCEVGPPAAGPAAGRYWRSLASRAWAAATGPPAGPVHLNLAFAEPLVPPQASGAAEGTVALVGPAAAATPGGSGLELREPSSGWPRLGGEPAPGRPGGAPWTAAPAATPPPGPAEIAVLAAAVRDAPRGVLVAGWGAELAPRAVDAFAAASGWPVLADPLSGARRGPHAVSTYDGLLRAPRFAAAHRPELAVRVGGGPTSKALAGWLDESVPQVLVDPAGGWLDPGRTASLRLVADPSSLLAATAAALTGPRGGDWLADWLEAERLARGAIDGRIDAWPEPFEGQVARDLVAGLPDGATLVVGSSMPVRDVDAFARPRDGLRFVANRGLSGIDGFVATALGVAAAGEEPVAALCGDLALLHDASTLLGAAGRPRGAVLVVCDNDGGGIFSFLPQARLPAELFEPLFGTPHGLDLAALAAAARLPCRQVEKAADLLPALHGALAGGGTELLLVAGDRATNLARHRAVTEAVAAAIGG
ncbi:MAG TPA: 2-succinyl-5-enolpyruvyl-6-hydroxy-3-cyclohexene-1-carboxylic-acid synthase [Actinomycetota bacterium]|nr:2-succinyl-5-enolpyruvyl-6-hydroxy-3-cyclohexene-1-carboxylic-acid synthase [Actinomycetota bacterium]